MVILPGRFIKHTYENLSEINNIIMQNERGQMLPRQGEMGENTIVSLLVKNNKNGYRLFQKGEKLPLGY